MKRIAMLMLTAALPQMAVAEDVYIRVEAKRDATEAAAAADGWQARAALPAVTFPIGGSWVAIGLGPLERDAAEARMQVLKTSGDIPEDAFLTPVEEVSGVTAATGPVADATETDATQDAASAPFGSTAGVVAVEDPAPPAAPSPAPEPDRYLRIGVFDDRAEADAALEKRRETLPELGLWTLPDGRFALAAGPLGPDAAAQWRQALVASGTIPEGSDVIAAADLGTETTEGSAPDWPAAPAEPAPMPPITEVQKALQWAGFYDGKIDGQDGPKTRAAIAAEIARTRCSTDPGTAMRCLFDRQEAWREEMGLTTLNDDHTGLALSAPMARLVHDRTERSLSIYGPKDGSGAALILFTQEGGQQEMEDLTGLITALGWVPEPTRDIGRGKATLHGANDTHIGHAEARLRDGLVEGFVLIWPVADAVNAPRIRAEIASSITRAQAPRAQREVEAPVAGGMPDSGAGDAAAEGDGSNQDADS